MPQLQRFGKNFFQRMPAPKGFSLIELLIVVALISLLGVSSVAVGRRMLVGNFYTTAVNETSVALRTAHGNSLDGKEASAWGVSSQGNQVIVFKGSSYASRDTAFDTVYSHPNSISVTDAEIVFAQVSGQPNGATTVTVSSAVGQSTSLQVNEIGVVNVE